MAQKTNIIYDSAIGDKANTKLAKRLQDIISDPKGLAKHLNVSIQAINQYKQGTAFPKVENLIKIADYYNISLDYLIGITDTKSRNTTLQAVCDYTGLSENSVEYLHNLKQRGSLENVYVIDLLLENARYDQGNGRSILEAVRFFMQYKDSLHLPPKQIHIDGRITDYTRTDGFIRSTAIKIDEQIIENAVLDEIKRKLIELKKTEEVKTDGKH